METKEAEFNGYKVELKKMRIKSANFLFPLVISGMVKLATGDFNFFTELKVSQIELFQEKLCENTLKVTESKQEDGSIIKIKKNLTLSDLDECIEGFLPLLFIFLEFNFGFFSQARKILDPILTKVSESKEN